MRTIRMAVLEPHERRMLKVACHWLRDEDREPGHNAPVVRLLAREGGPQERERLQAAAAELQRAKTRLHSNSLVGLPAGLVAAGTDLAALDEDIWAIAQREINPAQDLLDRALHALEEER